MERVTASAEVKKPFGVLNWSILAVNAHMDLDIRIALHIVPTS